MNHFLSLESVDTSPYNKIGNIFIILMGNAHTNLLLQQQKICQDKQTMHVITSFFMPVHSATRIQLYHNFVTHLASFQRIQLWTIQCVFPGQKYKVTHSKNQHHLRVRAKSKIWLKENLLNILLDHLPEHAQYIAWIDCDIQFCNVDWVQHAIAELKVHDVIQLFEDAHFLNADGDSISQQKSLMYYADKNLDRIPYYNRKKNKEPQVGYAWAMHARFRKKINKFFQYNIVGSGQKTMAYAFINMWNQGIEKAFTISRALKKQSFRWAINAIPDRGYSYIPGVIKHHYHGDIEKTNYSNLWQLLEKYKFNPLSDLEYNQFGVIELKSHQSELQKEIISYFQRRKVRNPKLELFSAVYDESEEQIEPIYKHSNHIRLIEVGPCLIEEELFAWQERQVTKSHTDTASQSNKLIQGFEREEMQEIWKNEEQEYNRMQDLWAQERHFQQQV